MPFLICLILFSIAINAAYADRAHTDENAPIQLVPRETRPVATVEDLRFIETESRISQLITDKKLLEKTESLIKKVQSGSKKLVDGTLVSTLKPERGVDSQVSEYLILENGLNRTVVVVSGDKSNSRAEKKLLIREFVAGNSEAVASLNYSTRVGIEGLGRGLPKGIEEFPKSNRLELTQNEKPKIAVKGIRSLVNAANELLVP